MKNIKKYLKEHRALEFTIVILLSLFIGWSLRGCSKGENENVSSAVNHNERISEKKVEIWTCSMHPQIRLPHKGKCPICGMDLIPADTTKATGISDSRIQLSESAVKLAEIETEPVIRKKVTADIRLSGKVAYDETRVRSITLRVPGRIDKMFVDFAGVNVKKDEKLVLLYSPELLSAQRELLGAFKLMKEMGKNGDSSNYITASKTYESVREKLLLLGITQPQIDAVLRDEDISDHLIIHSPTNGVVLEKKMLEGEYVEAGTEIYKVADLSEVWVLLDAYESDVGFLRDGLAVSFETESYPGTKFDGRVVFIDPVLDEKTRTIRVRVNAPNPRLALKPGMFVRSVIETTIGFEEETVRMPSKIEWTCVMHPQIVRTSPGKCPICGMNLVKKEVPALSVLRTVAKPTLVIPVSAPLITGKRAVVYVKVEGEAAIFEGREVELGPRAGDYYIVKSGLKEGEKVVVKGNFKIDSAMQIKAKRSMMSGEGEKSVVHHH